MTADDHAGPPIRVLLADDTSDIRLLLGIALRMAGGFTVVAEAANGQEAVALSEEHQPDLVLLDLAMPVMDGLQALPEIRRLSPRSVVVVLSGFGADTMAEEAVERGAQAYIQKGLHPSELAEQLRDLVLGDGVRDGAS